MQLLKLKNLLKSLKRKNINVRYFDFNIFNCFYQNADLFPNYQFRRLGYDNDTALSIGSFHSEVREEDKKSVKSLLSSNKNFIESEIIIIADRFLQDEVDALPILIDYLQKFSKKIILKVPDPERVFHVLFCKPG